MRKLPLFLALAAASLNAQWNPPNPVAGVERQPDGVLFKMQTGAMRLQVCSDSIVRVLYSPTSTFPERPDYVITKTTWPSAGWKMESTEADVSLVTARFKVTVTRKDGVVAYTDSTGKKLVQELSLIHI